MSSEYQRFQERAQRYGTALQLLPYARDFERLPFLAIMLRHMPRRRWRVLDTMAGTGFLSAALAEVGAEPELVDIAPAQLAHVADNEWRRRVLDATNLHLEISKETFDAVVHLAGLHHVYSVTADNQIDYEESLALQSETVSHWCELLRPGGILVLADVAEAAYGGDGPTSGRAAELALLDALRASPIAREWCTRAGCAVRDDELWTLQRYAQQPCWKQFRQSSAPVPSRFFEEVVSRTSSGHRACFFRPSALAARLVADGLEVAHSLVPTPWLFRSEPEAAWFFRELFSLAEPAASPDALSRSEVVDTLQMLDRLLGVSKLEDGGCAVWWMLAFVAALKP